MKLIYKHNVISIRYFGTRGLKMLIIARPDYRKDSAYLTLKEYKDSYKKL